MNSLNQSSPRNTEGTSDEQQNCCENNIAQSCQPLQNLKSGLQNIKEYLCDMWNPQQFRFVKTQIFLTFTKNNIIYIQNGQNIRMDEIVDTSVDPEIMNNLDQILYFQWQGNYGQNLKKNGKWTATWLGEKLERVGGYYTEQGKKQGLWIEIKKNYWNRGKVYEIGEYCNDQRIGKWIWIFQEKVIGDGSYNKESKKHGKWMELSQNFWELSQLIYHGEYQNGKKVGIWDIYICDNKKYQQIGGGSYKENNFGCEIKTGRWIEMSEEFNIFNQIIFIGDYQNGKKIGRWDIQLIEYDQSECIGGGVYDHKQGFNGFENSIKNGLWIELNDWFSSYRQVIHKGIYQDGLKIGRWDMLFRDNFDFYQIGGGVYDKQIGDDDVYFTTKTGMWIELYDEFNRYNQIIYRGEYQNQKKVGVWEKIDLDKGRTIDEMNYYY